MTEDFKTCARCGVSPVTRRGSFCGPCRTESRRLASRKYIAAHPEEMREARRKLSRIGILLSRAKHRAKKAGIPFNLRVNDLFIPAYCPVLGIRINPGGTQTDDSPSLDRIIPSLGYVTGNVVVVSWRANSLKKNATTDELRKLASFYSQFD